MIPERDRIQIVMTPAEIAEAINSGDYSAEMLMQHLIRHHNRLERELEQERQDRKQAEADVCRALGERNDARAELAALKQAQPAGDNPSPTAAEIDAHLDECVARSERDWKPLPGDPDVFYPRP